MGSRWEKQVLARVVAQLDPGALGGKAIRSAGLDLRILDAQPASHEDSIAAECRAALDALSAIARADGRLGEGTPLVKGWSLAADIYSPKLKRFIEVDEGQHFSKARLTRLTANRSARWAPLYPTRFWDQELPRLLVKPRRDLDPPHRHRDEQRAYRDELRERLPVAYGLGRTIRLDEFTLAVVGLDGVADLVSELLESEK